jgi:PKHD-type hydroxylase
MRIQSYVRGDYNDVHSDYDYTTQDYSKLTVVVPLVPRTKWKGGDLTVGNELATPKMALGDAIVFPSFLPHFVARVSKGTRVTLSAWISGPPLR